MTESVTTKLTMTSEREKSSTFGAVVFVVDENYRFFVIKELSRNIERKRNPGEFGVFCESRKPKEGWVGNIRRTLVEETGIAEDRFRDVFDFSDWSLWETGFVDKVWATVIKIKCKDPDLFSELFGKGCDPDRVESVGWRTLEEFRNMKPLREGVVKVLDKFETDIFKK